MQRLLPPNLFLIAVITMITVSWMMPTEPFLSFLSFPLTLLGLIPLIVGLGLSIRGSMKFSRVGTNIKPFNQPNVLVTDGLFRYSRNPMYLGFVIALCGVALLLGSVPALLIALAFAIVTDRWYIQFEERAMTRQFGQQYKTYQAQTRRWV